MEARDDSVQARASEWVDPLGESLALTAYRDTKNLLLGALDLRGPLDVNAMREAVARVGARFPVLRMRLEEVRGKGGFRLRWVHRPGQEIPFIIREFEAPSASASSLDVLLDCLSTDLERNRDLFAEPPCEVHLIKLAPDRHLLAGLVSHVAGDGIALSEISRQALIDYHEIVTGEALASPSIGLAASAAPKQAIRMSRTTWKDYWRTFRYAMIPYVVRCSLPRGSSSADDRREHHVKRVLTVEDSERVVVESSKNGVFTVDYLLAKLAAAIDTWNESRGTRTGTVTAAMTVNMQGRFQDMDSANNDSVLFFRLGREQRRNPDALARLILFSRMRLHRRQMDRKYSKAIAKFNDLFRALPFAVRQRVVARILRWHQTSFALGFFGSLWPSAETKADVADSYLTSAGGVSIAEVHGTAHKLTSRTPLYLSAYFFGRRLNLTLSAAGWLFSKDEARAFLDLVVSQTAATGGSNPSATSAPASP